MSINHYSPEARLYCTEQQQAATWLGNSHTPRFNLNDNQEEVEEEEEEVMEKGGGEAAAEEEEKEAMFEKPLTPSDVGKLNRLVIPKQHAEKHFPLESSSSSSCGDSAKGVLLSFEDESGKCWRFRYSYWNSSQSYVLTKGWSRYVKDKRLHAGDVVFFHRHRTHPQRFFITSTRRQPNPPAHVTTTATPSFYSAHPYPAHHLPFPYQPHSLHAPPGTLSSVCLFITHYFVYFWIPIKNNGVVEVTNKHCWFIDWKKCGLGIKWDCVEKRVCGSATYAAWGARSGCGWSKGGEKYRNEIFNIGRCFCWVGGAEFEYGIVVYG